MFNIEQTQTLQNLDQKIDLPKQYFPKNRESRNLVDLSMKDTDCTLAIAGTLKSNSATPSATTILFHQNGAINYVTTMSKVIPELLRSNVKGNLGTREMC